MTRRGAKQRLHMVSRHFQSGAKHEGTAQLSGAPRRDVGVLRIGPHVAIPVQAPDQADRIPPARLLLDPEDPIVLEHLEFLGKKWQLRQDVFLASPPGPYTRRLCQTFASLLQIPVEYISLHRDIGEAELLQQRSLEAGGNLRYDDGPVVRAMKHGHILLLDGIERAERGVMPVLNNILENREQNLADGTQLVPAARAQQGKERRFVAVHPDFRVFCLGVPVPPYRGHPLDPPFRSRFQARWAEGAVYVAPSPSEVRGVEKAHGDALRGKWAEWAALVRAHADMTQKTGLLPSTEQLPHVPLTAVPLMRDICATFPPVDTLQSPNAQGARPASPPPAPAPTGTINQKMGLPDPDVRRDELARPRPSPSAEITPIAQPTLSMLSTAYPALLDMPADKQKILREMLTRLGLDAGVGAGMHDTIAHGAGLLGFQIRDIVRKDDARATLSFVHPSTHASVTVDAACGPLPLVPLADLSTVAQDVLMTPRLQSILSTMLQLHAVDRDICAIPASLQGSIVRAQASSSKTVCVRLFAALLGFPVETLWLWKDIGGQELFMRRATTPDGATVWHPAPLSTVANTGGIIHLAGADVLGPTIDALGRLTQDRELELWEGTRLTLAAPDAPAAPIRTGEVCPLARNLRIIATAPNAAEWLTESVSTMFATLAAPPMEAEEEREILVQRTKCAPHTLDALFAFAARYREQSADPNTGLHKARRLGTRQMLRISMHMARFPSTDMYALVWRNQLANFLPRTVQELVHAMLIETGIIPHGFEGAFQYVAPLRVAPPAIDGGALAFSDEDGKSLLRVERYPWREKDPDGASLIPDAEGSFVHNTQQSGLLYSIVQDMVVLHEHLLLMGAQGTGKNKIIDQALELLDRPREYIQLNRDSTVGELLQRAYLENGQLRYADSPLIRAVKRGRVVVVDEVDKASPSVSAVFKSLAERGELSLPDGRRIVPFATEDARYIVVHPDFRLVLLANRPGWPFLGNTFTDVVGEGFSAYAVANPDIHSEIQLLEKLGPRVEKDTIRSLVLAFNDLRRAFDEDLINHPYSLRELIHIVRHLDKYPDEPLSDVMLNMLAFDLHRPEAMQLVVETFAARGLKLGSLSLERIRENEAARAKAPQKHVQFDQPDSSLDRPKEGKDDPNNDPHVGGNTWRGGTGGRDTAGLGGKGGYERVYKGHQVHQISDEEKRDVPDHITEEARAMARKALAEKLASDRLDPEELAYVLQIKKQVAGQVQHLANVLNALSANEHERKWSLRQQEGQLDERRLTDGLAGDRAIFKRRQEAPPEPGAPQLKPKRIRIVLDASASMYNMQFDGRLTRELEAAMLIMEAIQRVDPARFAFDMVAHSGDTVVIPLIRLGQLPKTDGERFRILRDIVTITRFCFAGDNTLECIQESVKAVDTGDADDYFVIALSDANLGRYFITPDMLGKALKADDKVKSAIIFIDRGAEAVGAAKALPGRAFVAGETREIPRILSDILTSMINK
ncbi:hypothetical protein MVES1_003389 [Malassezia vespertilionis]|uniref:ATPase dynein-related AAA domain-containing protein n=1 Tax=Malassezia vespertilionis TaxID=2020962 RepID=A0A2N1J7I3_9BASI|nr:uncharacterized protein MVES1_003389 [Malassezia vespertilionis]PKI82422.1 hypothetical protein MVES_003630 [Malassezia vespertilionis]WFD08020.1 hypothetical protein MVES1_003389 [Malassezia vespertilionis]